MPYIGKSPSFGVRNRFVYVASSGATSVSGADANGATLTFTDGAFVDVYLNGVLLKPTTDYNTSTANTIAGLSALNTNDEVTVVVYDIFAVADTVSATSGGTFVGNVNFSGNIDVDGTANLDVVDIDGAVDMATTLAVAGDVAIDTDTLFVDVSADKVGIGTTSPQQDLHLKADNPGGKIRLEMGQTGVANTDVTGEIQFYQNDASGAGVNADIKGICTNSVGAGALVFGTGTTSTTEAMRIDSNGHVTMPKKAMWWANGNANNNVANSSNGAYEVYTFAAETYDIGGGYNTSNGRYVAPVAGKYYVNSKLLIQGLNSSTVYYIDLTISVNGSLKLRESVKLNTYARAQTISVSGLVHCDASDYIEVQLRLENVSNQVVYDATSTAYFQGFLVG